MHLKIIVLTLLLTSSLSFGYEDYRAHLTVPKGDKMDLVKEGSTLRLQKETSVQKTRAPSDMFMSVLLGDFEPNALSVGAFTHTTNYHFTGLLPLATFQFNHYPWQKKGLWGWSTSIGYSYSQWQASTATALHIVPIELNLAYRAEFKSTQKIIPYVMAGPTLWTYFQRGLDEYNTSQTFLFGSASAGLAFNLNRMGVFTGRNESEILLQYQRNIGPAVGSNDFNGNTIQLGGTLAL